MIFKDYHEAKENLRKSRATYSEILGEKEELFQMTQPGAVDPMRDVIQAERGNPFDNYLEKLQKSGVEERLAEAKALVVEREQILGKISYELMESEDKLDRVFYLREVRRMRVNQIASYLGYSESHVYFLLREIRRKLNNKS